MERATHFLIAAACLGLGSIPVQAVADGVDRTYQLRRLLAPTAEELHQEAAGQIFIYEGLRDVQVARALDQQFHRINAMMFVGTVVTDGDGRPVRNRDTGRVETEDDGC